MKEILTDERIKKDVLRVYCNSIIETGMLYFVFLLIVLIFIGIFRFNIIIKCITVIISLIFLVLFFIDLLKIYSIRKTQLDIRTDTLLSKEKGVHSVSPRVDNRPYILNFKNYGICGLLSVNYKWSRRLCLRDKEIYNIAKINGIFYLVLSKDNKPLVAYDCELFKLQNY